MPEFPPIVQAINAASCVCHWSGIEADLVGRSFEPVLKPPEGGDELSEVLWQEATQDMWWAQAADDFTHGNCAVRPDEASLEVHFLWDSLIRLKDRMNFTFDWGRKVRLDILERIFSRLQSEYDASREQVADYVAGLGLEVAMMDSETASDVSVVESRA